MAWVGQPGVKTWLTLAGVTGSLAAVSLLLGGNGCGCKPCPETATPQPSPTPTVAPTEIPAWMTVAAIETDVQLHQLREWLAVNGLPNDWESVQKWQNQFDSQIVQIAQERGIPPMLLKALFMQESQFVPLPNNLSRPDALGIGQVLPSGIDTAFNFGNSANVEEWRKKTYELIEQAGDAGNMVDVSGQPISPDDYGNDYQVFYRQLHPDAQMLFRSYFIGFINNKCDYREALNGECANEGGVNMAEAGANLEFAADVLMAGDDALEWYWSITKRRDPQAWSDFWINLSDEDKWKVRVAVYNSGQGCIGDAIIAMDGRASSWNEIAAHLDTGCAQGNDERRMGLFTITGGR